MLITLYFRISSIFSKIYCRTYNYSTVNARNCVDLGLCVNTDAAKCVTCYNFVSSHSSDRSRYDVKSKPSDMQVHFALIKSPAEIATSYNYIMRYKGQERKSAHKFMNQ